MGPASPVLSIKLWNCTLEFGSFLNISIDKSVGITLPDNGVRQEDVKISKDGDAPIVDLEFQKLSRVGKFSDSQLRFNPSVAGLGTNLFLTLRTDMKLVQEDVIEIELPDFTGPTTNGLVVTPVGDSPSAWNDASWDNTSATLSLTVSHPIAATTKINLEVATESILKLPAVGVRKGQSNIVLKTTATWGPVLARPFAYLQSVGAQELTTPRLTWSKRAWLDA